MRAIRPVALVIFALFLGSAWLCCSRVDETTGPADAPTAASTPQAPASDEQLARVHCSTCHAYTPPEAITANGWKRVLLYMAVLTGQSRRMIANPPKELGEAEKVVPLLKDMLRQADVMGLVVPDRPILRPKIFRRLVAFYMNSAPEEPLPQSNQKLPIGIRGSPFWASVGITVETGPETFVTLVRIDEKNKRVLVGGRKGIDAEDRNYLAVHDLDGALIDEMVLDSPPVSVEPMRQDFLMATIGDFQMKQASNARLHRLTEREGKLRTSVLAEHLYRAASAQPHLEPDGSHLIAFHGFGYHSGSLTLFREKDWEILSRQELYQRPGTMVSRFADFNGDGLTDLLTLCSQEVETLTLLIQKSGGSGFEAHEVLRKFPVWGLTSFELADINEDGHLDLIVSNGDNGDWSNAPLKNFHGIRIYLWVGRDSSGLPQYEESFFQPMHGAFKVLARDFDRDGDLDLATIAQYADLDADPMENFLYFENQSQPRGRTFNFKISTVPGLILSTFTTMDAGDLDGDGDLDIVLGGRFNSKHREPRSYLHPPLRLVYLLNQ